LIAGQPNFIAMVMDGRNTAPIPMAAKIMRWVIRANESTTYRRCEERNLKRQGNVANRALEVLGKELRMFIDRKEFGRPGDFSGMSEDEPDKRIKLLLARLLEEKEAIACGVIGTDSQPILGSA
jgi:hypothetical protein